MEGDALVDDLVAMGFEKEIVLVAFKMTNYSGVENALNWILSNNNQTPSSVADSSQSPAISLSNERHKMVFVVNTSLNMRVGKTAAQVGHAAVDLYRELILSKSGNFRHGLELWEQEGCPKIVLKGDGGAEQLEQLKVQAEASPHLMVTLIQDAGRTEVEPGSRTVLGIFGPVSMVDLVTGSLNLLV